jgi:hypothetical protein
VTYTTSIPPEEVLEYYANPGSLTKLGRYAHLIKDLPEDIPGLCQALQGLVVHYVVSGIDFPRERKAEIDTRWSEDILKTIQARDTSSLTVARKPEERFVGCCRDFATLLVAILRERGTPARTRVGFSTYFSPDFNFDHVIAEYWNSERWVLVDPQMPPDSVPFNPHDMPEGVFITASQAWQRLRQGKLEPNIFGVAPHLSYKGDWFIRNYVVHELAALNKHEMLLWDWWGVMSDRLEGDLELIDHVANSILKGDSAWREWRRLFERREFKVPDKVTCYSPTGITRKEKIQRYNLSISKSVVKKRIKI